MSYTIINLDREFKPFGEGINYGSSVFPSGFEVNPRLPKVKGKILITTRIKSSNDIFMLIFTAGSLRKMNTINNRITEINVFMPYLPYARQDRAMIEEGEVDESQPYQEALSIQDFGDIMNLQKFNSFIVLDPHSDASDLALKNMMKISNHELVRRVLEGKTNYRIACPDAGAEKKLYKMCKAVGYTDDIIKCDKVRDVKTGNLISITVHADNLQGRDVFIVDDICDGGGTYIMQGQELKKKNAGDCYLITTHALLTRGEDVLKPYIKHIYTTDSMVDRDSDYVTQYKIQDIYEKKFARLLSGS